MFLFLPALPALIFCLSQLLPLASRHWFRSLSLIGSATGAFFFFIWSRLAFAFWSIQSPKNTFVNPLWGAPATIDYVPNDPRRMFSGSLSPPQRFFFLRCPVSLPVRVFRKFPLGAPSPDVILSNNHPPAALFFGLPSFFSPPLVKTVGISRLLL